jgi:glycine/D-amino acid oxidase-like deaminating enzyme
MLVCGCDQTACDPDALALDPDAREVALAKTARLLPGLADLGAARWWAGMRTLTDDDRFAVGPDPDVDDVHWCAGLGGHGMTAGAPAGELAAELLVEGSSTRPDAAALAPARLAALASAT